MADSYSCEFHTPLSAEPLALSVEALCRRGGGEGHPRQWHCPVAPLRLTVWPGLLPTTSVYPRLNLKILQPVLIDTPPHPHAPMARSSGTRVL